MSDKRRGNPGPSRDDDEEDVDLGISLRAVANIIDAARADETDDDAEDEDGAKADAAGGDLETLIDELNEDEQASLLALAWIGHGDYEPDEWEEALAAAREREEADPAGHLMGLNLLGDLLAEGLAAFGIVVEEIER
ncbi:DUF3775 domain-containing protein [Muricoccus pecuniae]|uniref:DUF3775 domain-containing protein n=1 Tax=Muricoccus pecuniae TaxID=693023 RepID=A0A840XU18_9PROT|nr:DUF3775 domain-containing protein [Roseomonas pecuniae]MBB5692198.1 hypothetical protein [Roseomonas pecuniae]